MKSEDVVMEEMWDDYNVMQKEANDLLECYVQKYMENDDREAEKCKRKFVRKYGKKNWRYY